MSPPSSAIRPIRSDAGLRRALAAISDLMRSPEDGPNGDRLEVLSAVVAAYEREHHPIDPPTAVEAIRFRIDQGAMTRSDLEAVVGRSHAWEVLNGKRPLSLAARQTLHERFGIPAESLLK